MWCPYVAKMEHKEYVMEPSENQHSLSVYAAAYDANIEWVIVKGVASYFNQSQSASSEWMSFASTIAASVVAKMLNDPTVFREWPHYNQGVEHATLGQGYSLLKSGDLESARATQAMIQHRGADHGTLEQGASLMTSNRLSSAMASQSRIKEYHGKRPLHPLETTTPERQRQNTDIPDTDIDFSVVVKLLKGEYNRRSEFSPLLWSKGMKLQLKEVYTRLKVVSRRKAGRSEIDMAEIDVDDIFKSSEEDNGQLVLVEGSPGIGKTTFCLKLAHDWANGAISRNFPTFKLVFLLKCRDMKGGVLEDIDLVEEIFEQLLPEDLKEKTKGALVNFLEDLYNQNQILIIFDGLDELPEKLRDHLDKFLGRKKLSFCYVLATTRQEKGIHTREQFQFDICLAIEGFSRESSFEYIRKHFRNIGPEHSSRGRRLIEEVKQNPLLRDLQKNPLNLLLLCVIYEDYEGSLPSSFTDLYQTIVRCLLKRYCSKDNLKASEKDEDLDKQFEMTILALGELAWECLLNDRLSFYEDELEELERRSEIIVARRLGLVYKEESFKRLKPRHAYSFLRKTFQEYLAASYIAHKLRGSEFHILKQGLFPGLGVNKFRQVFFFVCGILREEANILFEHIGNMLQKQ
ncbi:NLR family CARD domain-containing protein 4-like [Acropora muricata]|uniref:NLR family CARD domain-containing protein 4-like n=1 Tax=Acropora muricata TaxID=159855 RepID=UPI0034E57F1F